MVANRFLEEFVKERIINEFCDYMALHEGKDLYNLLGLSDPILTMCKVDADTDNIMKFELCNIAYCNLENRENEFYNIFGIISIYNNGRIIIAGYDRRDK